MSDQKDIKKDTIAPLNPSRFNGADFERTVYVATVEQGTKKEQIIESGFWAHIAARVRPWDRIEVRSDDGIFIAELLVLSAGRNWVKVHLLSFINLTSGDVSQTQAEQQDYAIKFMGPHKKWSVLKGDGASRDYLRDGFDTEAQAREWLRDHEKAIG